MPLHAIATLFAQELAELAAKGAVKGKEKIIDTVLPPAGDHGPRYRLQGYGEREFIKMNSNSYLGLTMHPLLLAAEHEATETYGTGPGAVRFISGTSVLHRALEKRLAAFHGRQDAMIFSAAYATVLGVIAALTTADSVIISDALNHNSIINAVRLGKPVDKKIYPHLDLTALEDQIKASVGQAKRLFVVTDGVFSMRGDYAPLNQIRDLVDRYDQHFPQNIVLVVDDSHGVGGFGETGRGTEEYTHGRADVLIGTMGKAFGVNGGYVVSDQTVITYLREKAATYIYSNPITPGEAAAAMAAIELVDTPEGAERLSRLRNLTKRFEQGLQQLGFEVIESGHPVVPLMVRDTARTAALVKFLFEQGVLATGLNFPVVPEGDQSIRFQVNADHTEFDIDAVLAVLKKYQQAT